MSDKILRGVMFDKSVRFTAISAKEMVDRLIKDMAVKQGITEEFKAKDQRAWVGAKNNIHHSAEEILYKDLIFR